MMKKKIVLPLLLLNTALLLGTLPFSRVTSDLDVNQNINDLIETTVDFENERNGISYINARNAVIVDEELSVSDIFVQYAYNEDEHAYYLRFATAVRGDIDNIKYVRGFADGSIAEATFNVEKVYQGIIANNEVYYYDGENNKPTTDSSFAGQYYWACYTARFENSSLNIAKGLNVSLKVNDELIKSREDVSLSNQLVSKYETLEEEFDIMSFNIRTFTNSDTGNKSWDTRKSHLIDYILNSGMDVISFQEVRESQWGDLKRGLAENYDVIFYPREMGNTSSGKDDTGKENPEGLAIAYNNTFELIEKDVFWLSSTPDKISINWDSYIDEEGNEVTVTNDKYYRICVNALLRSEKGVYLNVFNAHLGLNAQVRELGAKLVAEKMKQSKYPSMVMGDFNASPSETTMYNQFADFLQDCQQTAEITEKEGTGSYTYNGWAAPKSIIDYIFVDDSFTPMTFDVNQETWNGNLYSDHYAIDTHVKVQYTRELLKNIRSIDFKGDVNISSDMGVVDLDAEVEATYFDGTTAIIPHDYYTIDLPEQYNVGEAVEDVTVTLNGNKNITATATPTVRTRYQAEEGTVVGGKREFRQIYAEPESNSKVIQTNEIYGHFGGFEDAARAGKQATITINVNSKSNSVVDLSLRASNVNFEKIASNSDGNGDGDTKDVQDVRFATLPLRINKIMDLYVNGELTCIPDDAILGPVFYGHGDWAGMYHILHDVLIRDVALNEGDNTIKFAFKAHADGLKDELYNNVIASSNVDCVDVITKSYDLNNEKTLTGLMIENDATYQVNDTVAKEVKVKGVYSNGTTRLLDASEYTLQLLSGETLAADQTKFVAGNYTLTATYNGDDSITTSKDISAVTYNSVAKSSRLYKDGNNVYFEMVFTNSGYTVNDYIFFHYSKRFQFDTGVQTGNTLVLTINLTNQRDNPTFASGRIILHGGLVADGQGEIYYGHKKDYGDLIHNGNSSSYKKTTSIDLDGYHYEFGNSYGDALQITKISN